ncbi:hypothetical protein [Rhizobium sp. WYJ-E13]|uniref:hypothetical protein n=1 Tax=unclassified Rhizobium TaxID=2613769 RepID=UPI001C1EBAD3|nr:hypothetical protein [Rhizobium sp. WYJ-E13]QWW67928.1 hypothetical protein KQ933_20470 [Rhizobium sp. WYJ-E13]
MDDDILSGKVRPPQIPSHWVGKPTSSSRGWRWDDPDNSGNGVRFFAGDPDDPVPSKRNTYVVVVSGGVAMGADGNPIPGFDAPE